MKTAQQPYPFKDAHAHIFPAKIARKATNAIGAFYGIEMDNEVAEAAALAQIGQEAGIVRSVVCSTATVPAQVRSINDFIAGICREYPQFVGLATLHPDMEDPEGEVERILKLGLHGIKLHPDFQHFALDDEAALPLYHLAAQAGLPILFHMGDKRYNNTHPAQLKRVLEKVPKLRVIAAHLGGFSEWDEAAALLVNTDVLVDTSSSLPFLSAERAAQIIRAFGAERCMFGSDFPMWRPDEEIERFLALPLTETERAQIAYKTFTDCFGV